MRKYFYISLILAVFLLTGCATQMEPPFDHQTYQKQPWKLRRVKISDKVNWYNQGAVSITSSGKTQMGSFSWKQRGDQYAINIYGPLNLGAIGIAGSPGAVTLVKPNGRFTAPNAETLMQAQLGWYLPVSNMYYWIRALPAPGKEDDATYDNFGHLIMLQQQGWTIQYQAYQSCGDADFPRKIIMDNQALHVKLVISNWNFDA